MIRIFALHLLFKKRLDDYDFLIMANHMWEFPEIKFTNELTKYILHEKGIDLMFNFIGE